MPGRMVNRIELFIGVFLLSMFLYPSSPVPKKWKEDYKLLARWVFPEAKPGSYILDSVVDASGRLVIMGMRWGIKIITQNQIKDLAKFGEGPGDILHPAALYTDRDYLVDIENYGRLVYFRDINGEYKYYKTEWLRNREQIVRGGVYCNGKWYLTGFLSFPRESFSRGYFLTIFDAKGRLKKRELFIDFKKPNRPYLLSTYIRKLNGKVWIALEHRPTIYIVDCKTDKLERKITLKVPAFYKPFKKLMPPPKRIISSQTLQKIYEDWIFSYSRIENMLLDEKNLILQIRTASSKLPTYAVLFYDNRTFKLKNIYFANHRLLGEKNGKFYFFENGDPGLDDLADTVAIRIYGRRKK